MKRNHFLWLTLLLILIVAVISAASALAPEESGFKMRTSKFLVFQETSDTTPNTILEKNFSLFFGESNPTIQNAYIEIKGISGIGSGQSMDVQIKQQGDQSYSNLITFTFDVPSRVQNFRLYYNIKSYLASIVANSGTYNFTLYVKNTGPANFSALQAKGVLTYNYVPPSSGYRTSGYITSSTFDTTGSNGAAPNAIMWKGTLPSTSHVKFQFASSNCSNGATNPSTCDSGTWSYIGPDGTVNTYYEPSAPDTPLKLDLSYHNNKRYFKYKVILNPTNDQQQTPTVDDIILNWSP